MSNLFKNILTIRKQSVRFIPRFNQTFPVNLIEKNLPEEDCNDNFPIQNFKRTPKTTSKEWRPLVIRHKQENSSNVLKSLHMPGEDSKTMDNEGNLVYTKMANNDERISKIMSILKNKKKGSKLMLLEGKRLIQEALMAHCKLKYLLFSRLSDVEQIKLHLPPQGALYKLPYRELQTWSDLTTNPGIMGIFHIPTLENYEAKDPLPLSIICDNMREPSNLGAVLRSASAVGAKEVILTKGCTNLWDSKVLRSACGGHFRLRIYCDVNSDTTSDMVPQNTQVFIADNNTDVHSSPVPLLPYYSPLFSSFGHIVLIIGGETQGVSDGSFKLAEKFKGQRLHVPLSNGVESLNTGTALGVIAFEIKRQFLVNK